MKSSLFTTAIALVTLNSITASAQQANSPVRRAVIAGVDIYQESSNFTTLRGCANDADSMAALLKEKFGFQPEEIVLLKNSEVTGENLRKALRENLIEALPADGVGVFYYAGHGVGIPDLNGDEADDRDEALVLHNTTKFNFGSYLADDEIETMLKEVKTSNVLLMLDTCHSGTANRTTSRFAEFRTVPLRWGTEKLATRSVNQDGMVRSAKGHVVLSACQADQLANELFGADFAALGEQPQTVPCGLFTWSLRQWMSDDNQMQAELGQAVTSLSENATKATTVTKKAQPQQPWFDLAGRQNVSLATLLAGKAGVTAGTQTPAPAAPAETITFTADGVAHSGAIGLEMKINKREFKDKEHVVLEVKAAEDCYARLYVMNCKGEITQLFPNEHHKDNFLPKDRVVRIPGAAWGFQLEMGAPYGVEALKLVTSNTQFTDLQNHDWATGLFQQVNITNLQQMNSRGLRAQATDSRYGHATVFYEVLDPAAPAAPATGTQPAAESPTPPAQ